MNTECAEQLTQNELRMTLLLMQDKKQESHLAFQGITFILMHCEFNVTENDITFNARQKTKKPSRISWNASPLVGKPCSAEYFTAR